MPGAAPLRLYWIAGEDSGDLHTAGLIGALRERHPALALRGVGGDRMAAAGVELLAHVRDINFMGFWEVVKHLGTIRRLFRQTEADIRAWKPDAAVLTDYPGFNLRMARFLHRQGIPVVYYISPQVWAWKEGRVEQIRRYVRRMICILPFEQAFYQRHGLEVAYAGHPLLDVIGEPDPAEREPVLALLPGSREQEIRRMLPEMLEAAAQFPELQAVVAGAPSQPEALYRELIGSRQASLVMNQTYPLLRRAQLALVTSGTATLETALHGVPQAVCYKGAQLSYLIARRLIRVPYISLVNLILNRPAVRELIQHQCTAPDMAAALREVQQPEAAARIQQDYADLRSRLGSRGASARAAAALLDALFPTPG
ncbi:MAG: lipid-A-disaccharide synthase [Bacteroidia bacterium]|nr:lipid-A-disaccharide synthase [Bacteroidia bacterium]